MVLSIFKMDKNRDRFIATVLQLPNVGQTRSREEQKKKKKERVNCRFEGKFRIKMIAFTAPYILCQIIERNGANNNNEFRAYNNKCGAKHSTSKRSTIFCPSVFRSVNSSVCACVWYDFSLSGFNASMPIVSPIQCHSNDTKAIHR